MNKTIRNYLLDMALFLLLSIDIVSLARMHGDPSSGASAAHIVSSVLLVLGCLVHITWHWRYILAVLSGKVKGKIKLGMNSMVTVMMVLAGFSGFAAQATGTMDNFHGAVGSIALMGLFIHSVKHLHWMFSASKKFTASNEQQKANWPA
jgi:hypothetical protein